MNGYDPDLLNTVHGYGLVHITYVWVDENVERENRVTIQYVYRLALLKYTSI